MKYLFLLLILSSCQILTSPAAIEIEEEIIIDIIQEVLEEVENKNAS